MAILKRNKASFALHSLQQSATKYVTGEFGATIEEPAKNLEDENEGEDLEEDLVASIIGKIGKYQLMNCILMGLTGLTFSWVNYGTKFITTDTEFWCAKVIICCVF